ncbi:MAG: ABC transporter permease [Solirubrobacteraceae bacterium]|nr:ABC transporter permease [Solirubrobacteraceae bacterium]
MTRAEATWLIARREIVERARDRTFQIGTLVSVVIIAVVVVLSAVLGGGDDRYTLAVVRGDDDSARIAKVAAASLEAGDAKLKVREAATLEAARDDVGDDRVDAVLTGAGAQIIVQEDLDERLGQALRGAASTVALDDELADAGVSEADRRGALAPPRVAVRAIAPDDDGAAGVAFVAALLLYGQLITFGMWVANGIAEEKGSRVVELLLSAIPSTPLLAGKILGIGVLGFVQLLVIAVPGIGLAGALDVVDLDAGMLGALAVTLGFFLLGYLVYAALFAVAGALVSRQEDVQSTVSPLLILLVASFFIALQAMQDPSSMLASVAALVPLSSPMVMPPRVIAGDAGTAEALLAVALLVLTAAGVLALAARVYDHAILRMGARVPLREALAIGR